ncbi:MAG: TraB/GumN family protein [Polyangiaceae bacterium]|nr:TraB/GumN family protein [Polyangiaceae bacterium]
MGGRRLKASPAARWVSCLAVWGLLVSVSSCSVSHAGGAPNPRVSSQHEANTPATDVGGVPAASRVHGLFWRARGKLGSLYVLGSLPVVGSNFFPLDPRIEEAFARSTRLTVEVHVPEAEKERAAERLVAAARYSDPDTLKGHLSAGTWESLSAVLGSEQARDALGGFRPWFIALNLELGQLEYIGADADQSLESHFLDRAVGKAVVALTTPEQQVRELQNLSDELAERRLQSVLENLPRMKRVLEEASGAWRERRAEVVANALDGRLRAEFPDVFAELWLPRCRSFALSLLELSQQPGNTFAVVDVSLLVGKGGILEELARRGLRVDQL